MRNRRKLNRLLRSLGEVEKLLLLRLVKGGEISDMLRLKPRARGPNPRSKDHCSDCDRRHPPPPSFGAFAWPDPR
jgi:hypothetical protein